MASSVSDVNIPKLSRSFGLQPALDPQRHRRIVHGRLDQVGRARLDEQLDVRARAEHLLEHAERNDRELVLRLAEDRALLLADADDAEVQPADPDDLVDGLELAEQPLGRLRAEHGDLLVAIDLARADAGGRARRRTSGRSR